MGKGLCTHIYTKNHVQTRRIPKRKVGVRTSRTQAKQRNHRKRAKTTHHNGYTYTFQSNPSANTQVACMLFLLLVVGGAYAEHSALMKASAAPHLSKLKKTAPKMHGEFHRSYNVTSDISTKGRSGEVRLENSLGALKRLNATSLPVYFDVEHFDYTTLRSTVNGGLCTATASKWVANCLEDCTDSTTKSVNMDCVVNVAKGFAKQDSKPLLRDVQWAMNKIRLDPSVIHSKQAIAFKVRALLGAWGVEGTPVTPVLQTYNNIRQNAKRLNRLPDGIYFARVVKNSLVNTRKAEHYGHSMGFAFAGNKALFFDSSGYTTVSERQDAGTFVEEQLRRNSYSCPVYQVFSSRCQEGGCLPDIEAASESAVKEYQTDFPSPRQHRMKAMRQYINLAMQAIDGWAIAALAARAVKAVRAVRIGTGRAVGDSIKKWLMTNLQVQLSAGILINGNCVYRLLSCLAGTRQGLSGAMEGFSPLSCRMRAVVIATRMLGTNSRLPLEVASLRDLVEATKTSGEVAGLLFVQMALVNSDWNVLYDHSDEVLQEACAFTVLSAASGFGVGLVSLLARKAFRALQST